MGEFDGKICPYCKGEFKEGDAVKVCEACGIPHHLACWNENGGCTTYGCSRHAAPKQAENLKFCPNCGASIEAGQQFCQKCGQKIEAAPAAPQSTAGVYGTAPAGRAGAYNAAPAAGQAGAYNAAPAAGQAGAYNAAPAAGQADAYNAAPAAGQADAYNAASAGQSGAYNAAPAGQAGAYNAASSEQSGTYGAAQSASPNVCSNCGTSVSPDQQFCPKCGQKIGMAVDASTASSINQYNADVEKKKKTKPMPLIIGAVALVVIVLAFVLIQSGSVQRAKDDYMKNAKDFAALILTAGENIEDIADTVQSYWYDCIWNDTHGNDINTAVKDALRDKSSEVSKAKEDNVKIIELYQKLKTLPNGVTEQEYKDICDAVKDMYDTYADFYSFATDPTGNYTTFSSGNSSKTSDFIEKYRTLNDLLK